MQREFSTEAVMTLLCAINCCQDFNDVKELVGWLLNVDHITTIDAMANAPICGATLAASQFPEIAQSLKGVNEDNWMAYRDVIIAVHGEYLTVSKAQDDKS